MSGNRAAAWGAIVLGVLAVAAIPAGVLLAQYDESVELLDAVLAAVPVALVLGLVALSSARRARYRQQRSLDPEGRGRRVVKLARFTAWAGLYAGITGALALAVYGLLRWSG
jgi:uncharacterized membrane protein YfcA